MVKDGARHLLSVIRSGQIRFRAETFGLYYPALPENRPWWQISMSGLRELMRTGPAYVRWLGDMERIAAHGAHEWWGQRCPGIDLEGELTRLDRERTRRR